MTACGLVVQDRWEQHRGGLPYIEHPTRVAARLVTSELKAVALLHDVLEDTDVTVEDLAAAGLPKAVIDGVIAMTKRPGDDYSAAVARAARHPLARAVKAADIADNADPQRLALLPTSEAQRLREKYELGRRVLANERSVSCRRPVRRLTDWDSAPTTSVAPPPNLRCSG